MNEGILIFNDAEDFLNAIEELQEHYLMQHEGAVEKDV